MKLKLTISLLWFATKASSLAMGANRLLHAMLKVSDVDSTVAFWESKGAKRLTPQAGKGSCFVGYGSYRDTEHFALELAPAPPDATLINTKLAFFGLSQLPEDKSSKSAPPSSLEEFMAARQKRMIAPGFDPQGLEARQVAGAPGDPLARICLLSDDLEASKAFYVGGLGMREVARSEEELCLRYEPLEGGLLDGVPTTLVFTSEGVAEAASSPGTEAFDHLAICCRDVLAARDFLDSKPETSNAVTMEPTKMFGTAILGLSDPNGLSIFLVEEDGFRNGV